MMWAAISCMKSVRWPIHTCKPFGRDECNMNILIDNLNATNPMSIEFTITCTHSTAMDYTYRNLIPYYADARELALQLRLLSSNPQPLLVLLSHRRILLQPQPPMRASAAVPHASAAAPRASPATSAGAALQQKRFCLDEK